MARERILLSLQGADAERPTAIAAAKLAASLSANLDCIYVEPDPSSYLLWTGPGAAASTVMASAIEAVREESEELAEAAKAIFLDALVAAGLKASDGRFIRVTDNAADAAAEARLARLFVACPVAAAGRGPLADLATAVLIDEQTPIYVPRGGMTPPETVAIAWDGSREAARAVYGAAPILSEARQVTVLHANRGLDYNDRRTAPPERLVEWLSARGKRAEAAEVADTGDIGEALLDAAKGADLIVAGAYGHSRLREFVFGGVTRTLLKAEEGPSLLLAH